MTHEIPENAYAIVKDVAKPSRNCAASFVNGGGISGVPERQKAIKVVCCDIGPETRLGLTEGLIIAALCHPLDKLPRELIEVMLGQIERRDSLSIEQRIVPFEVSTPESIWN